MRKVTINVLASDFENNRYLNCSLGSDGCPLQRAFIRAGVFSEYKGSYQNYLDFNGGSLYEEKVQYMFKGDIPIEDFSFEITL
jgi:hypothetical protein